MTYIAIYLIVVVIAGFYNKRAWDFIEPLEPKGKAQEVEA
jgi:hypothetical protein